MSSTFQYVEWQHNEQVFKYRWYSEAENLPPSKLLLIDDTITANKSLEYARQGIGMIWVGDYQNGRNLLKALVRRLDRPAREGSIKKELTPIERFAAHRLQQKNRAELLGKVLIALTKDFAIELKSGQDVVGACTEVLGKVDEGVLMPLKQLLALVSAHEWRKKQISLPFLHKKITPHFGVFSPVRGEYLELVQSAKLPEPCELAFDIGTGTGVLAILLAQKGIPRIIASDIDQRAIECAQANIVSLGLEKRIDLVQTDLFPPNMANLIICNPPWLPGEPSSSIENAVFDPNSKFLKGFLLGARNHLQGRGQVWLILSDLAEHLGLRTRESLMEWIATGGLSVINRLDIKAKHPKSKNVDDPLYFARVKEITSLWILESNSN